MKKTRFWARLSLVMVAVLIGGVMAACKPPEVMPAEEIEYAVVYDFGDWTGPYSAVTVDMMRGRQDFFKWINAAGGIDGTQIKHVWADDNNVLARSIAIYKQFLASTPRPSMIIIGSSPVGEMLTPMAEQDEVALFQYGGMSEAQAFPPRWTWFQAPAYAEVQIGLCEWYAENRYKGEGVLKVGNICVDDPFGRAAYGGTERYAEEKGTFEIVGLEFTSQLPSDTTPQLTRLKEAGAGLVYLQGLTVPGYQSVMRDRAKLGYWDMGVGHSLWVGPALLMDIVGPEMSEGYIFSAFTYMPEEKNEPGIQLAWDIAAEYRPGYEPVLMYIDGLSQGEIAAEVMKRALEAKGSVDLSGEDIMAAISTMKGYSGHGFGKALGGPIDANDRRLSTDVRIYEVAGGKQVAASDWFEVPHVVPPGFEDLLK